MLAADYLSGTFFVSQYYVMHLFSSATGIH